MNLFGRPGKRDRIRPKRAPVRTKKKNSSFVATTAPEDDGWGIDHDQLFEPFFFSIPLDLAEALRKPQMRNQFREFLKRSYAHENLLFFETIELYQKIDKAEWRAVAGKQMIEKFVKADAPMQVNLSHNLQLKIIHTTTFSKHTFDSAKREIYQLMVDNFFDRFVQELLNKPSEEEEEEAKEEDDNTTSRKSRPARPAGYPGGAPIRRTSSFGGMGNSAKSLSKRLSNRVARLSGFGRKNSTGATDLDVPAQ